MIVIGFLSFYFGMQQHTDESVCTRIPIRFSSANTPVVNVVIEGAVFSCEIDLGAKFPLVLNSKLLKPIQKKFEEVVKWRDLKGVAYEGNLYAIPEISISGFLWKDVRVQEENSSYTENIVLWTDEKQNSKRQEFGTIGRPLLERTNLCFDMANRVVFACDSMESLKQLGEFYEDFEKFPFELTRAGMVLEIVTDFGKGKFIIDTGSTLTLVRASFLNCSEGKKDWRGMTCVGTSKFIIGNKNFGNMDLYPWDISSELIEMDGMLGMDFLKNQVFYIDYPNKVIYIRNAEVNQAVKSESSFLKSSNQENFLGDLGEPSGLVA